MRDQRGFASGLVVLPFALALTGCGGGGGDGGSTPPPAPPRADSPPVISLETTPPTELTYGSTATFKVKATDPDGDAIPGFDVVHGPAGFTVTPQGDVTWTASGPLFDRVTDFSWGIRVRGTQLASGLVEGTITVTDPTREHPLRRTNVNIPVAHSGLRITDLDGDNHTELLVGSSLGVYVLGRRGSTYRQSWVYPFEVGTSGMDVLQSVTSADIDGDHRQEIYFSKAARLVRLDGVQRRVAAEVGMRCSALEIADLDGDGARELVCLNESRVYVLNPVTLAEIWATPQQATVGLGESMAIGNVDADAALEIVTSGGFVYDGATRTSQWSYGQAFGKGIDTGDVDGDGVNEIVGGGSGAVRAYNAVSQSQAWEYLAAGIEFSAISVADANGDGHIEAITGSSGDDPVIAIGYNTTTHLPELLWQLDAQEEGVTSIAVDDVNDDGINEIVWGAGSAASQLRAQVVIAGFTPTISVKWQSGSNLHMRSRFYGGELARIGAGATSLMFAVPQTEPSGGMRVVAMAPMIGDVDIGDDLGVVSSGFAPRAVADYDHDNIDEVFFGNDEGFGVYDFAARSIEWLAPRQPTDPAAFAVEAADMNNDGYADLVGLNRIGQVEIHDVHGQAQLWRSPAGLGNSLSLATGDLDNDGRPEIVVSTASRLVVYGRDSTGTTFVERANIASDGGNVFVADLEGDSSAEVYLWGGGGFRVYTPTLLRLGTTTSIDSSIETIRAMFVEKSAFGRKNLLVSGTDDAFPSRSRLFAISPVDGKIIWRSPYIIDALPDSLQYVDIDDDGDDEIVFGAFGGMYQTR